MLNVAHYWRNENQNHSEISPHTGQNGHYHKVYKEQTVEKVWRKGKVLALLAGM